MLLLAALLLAGGVPAVWAARPSDLAPGAPELGEAELRLGNLLETNRSVAAATARLQEAWALPPPAPTTGPPPKDPARASLPLTRVVPPAKQPCADTTRLALGWRIERFGAAWREAAQAVRIEAERVQALRQAPTIAPLLDAGWSTRLDDLDTRAQVSLAAWREASAWQGRYVRPLLQACPAPPVVPAPGYALESIRAQGERAPHTAILAQGDGWVCPTAVRADDAIVLIDGASACWSAGTPCGCEPHEVLPGAILGPEAPPTAESP